MFTFANWHWTQLTVQLIKVLARECPAGGRWSEDIDLRKWKLWAADGMKEENNQSHQSLSSRDLEYQQQISWWAV